jgi:hypothetical protein
MLDHRVSLGKYHQPAPNVSQAISQFKEASMPQVIQFTASVTPRFPLVHARRWWKRRLPKLDLNSLPDHLKRDLGFMGGRTSPMHDPLRD